MIDVPLVIPVTTPVPLTNAMAGETELQAPPPTASLRVVLVVGHTTRPPVILPAFGKALTVTTTVAATVPQLFVTV